MHGDAMSRCKDWTGFQSYIFQNTQNYTIWPCHGITLLYAILLVKKILYVLFHFRLLCGKLFKQNQFLENWKMIMYHLQCFYLGLPYRKYDGYLLLGISSCYVSCWSLFILVPTACAISLCPSHQTLYSRDEGQDGLTTRSSESSHLEVLMPIIIHNRLYLFFLLLVFFIYINQNLSIVKKDLNWTSVFFFKLHLFSFYFST